MKKISLFLPSRERPALLRKCLRSIFRNAAYPERVDLTVVFDDDDESRHEAKTDISFHNWQVFCLEVPRSKMQQRDYYGVAARLADGDYLCALNDDVEFATKGWDIVLETKIEEFLADKPNRLAYVAPFDGTHMGRKQERFGCCFPFVTREFYTRMGCFFPEELASWGADVVLYQIVQMAKVPVLWLPEVEIRHHTYHNGTREKDKISEYVEQISLGTPQTLTPEMYQAYAEKLSSSL